MTVLKTIEIILIILGLLFAFVGYQFSIPILLQAGIACFGLGMIVIGWQGILTRHMVLRRRRRGTRRTYTGVAAIFQGIQFNFSGLFLVGIALMMYFNNEQQIALQIARRPGLLLVVFGGVCLMQALITFSGTEEYKQGSQGWVTMNLLVARLLPGLILVIVGVALSLLGLFEAVAPERFDELGGQLLEQVYGVR
jgi:hypothetical protein